MEERLRARDEKRKAGISKQGHSEVSAERTALEESFWKAFKEELKSMYAVDARYFRIILVASFSKVHVCVAGFE